MKKAVSIFVAAFLTMLGYASAAMAAVDEAGAQELRKNILDTLATYDAQTASTGEAITRGDITVTPNGDHYLVHIPDIGVEALGAGKLDVGTVDLQVKPLDNNQYSLSGKIPSPIKYLDLEGNLKADLTIANQSMSGTLDMDNEIFPYFKMEYDDVVMTVYGDTKIMVGAKKIAGLLDMRRDGGSLWSGARLVNADNIYLRDEKGETSLTIEKMQTKLAYNDIDLSVAKKLRQDLEALAKEGDTQAALEATQQKLADAVSNMPDDIISTLSVSNIALDVKEAPATEQSKGRKPLAVRIKSLTSNSDLVDMKKEMGRMNFGISLRDLSVPTAPAEQALLIPQNANLDISVDKMPSQEIGALFYGFVQKMIAQSMTGDSSAAKDPATEAAIEQDFYAALAGLPGVLAKAGTSITIKDTYADMPGMYSKLAGVFKASTLSPYIFSGQLVLSMNGLVELIDTLKDMSEKHANTKAAAYAQGLIFLRLSGQQAAAENNKSVITYTLDLNDQGQATLNGIDLSLFAQTALPALGGGLPTPGSAPMGHGTSPAAPSP